MFRWEQWSEIYKNTMQSNLEFFLGIQQITYWEPFAYICQEMCWANRYGPYSQGSYIIEEDTYYSDNYSDIWQL